MPVKVADVNIIHIIQAALLSMHMGFDKTGINNIVDKRIIDLIRSSMRFKISLHIDKITDCDNSAAGILPTASAGSWSLPSARGR